MIAAISIAFLAYASPLASAKDYIWTTPNMPSNIAGVVAGPFARTEDVAYIHEAIAERRVLGGFSSGANTLPVQVLRSAALPLAPQQAQARGWQVASTGIVDGVASVLSYWETVTNWPKAGGVDTWRMSPVTFELPGGWLHPSNDVMSLHSAVARYGSYDNFTNCFSRWWGFLSAANMTLGGLAWRPALTNILHRLADYSLHEYGGTATNYTSISTRHVSDPYVETSADGKTISLVPDSDTTVYTNENQWADFGFSVERRAYKVFQTYYDPDSDTYVQCNGSPLSYTYSSAESLTGAVGGEYIAVSGSPFSDVFATGGVQRITGVTAIALLDLYYSHYRNYEGTGYETVSATNLAACVPVAASLDGTYLGRPLIRIASSPAEIVAAAISAANLPSSDSGFIPPEPGGTLTDGLLENSEHEELGVYFQGYSILLSIKPLTTIQELQ